MNVIEMPVGKIIPYDRNPRRNDNAVDAVAESIRRFGFQHPLVLDRNNVVIVGHTRLRAAIKLGMFTVPVVIAEDLTEAQAKAYRLADNKTAEKATWDFEKLWAEMDALNGAEMAVFGFDRVKIEKPDEIVDEEKKTSQTGEKKPEIIICPRCGHIQGEHDEDY